MNTRQRAAVIAALGVTTGSPALAEEAVKALRAPDQTLPLRARDVLSQLDLEQLQDQDRDLVEAGLQAALKSIGSARTRWLQVRLSDTEYASLRQLARAHGSSMSDYVRDRLLQADREAGR